MVQLLNLERVSASYGSIPAVVDLSLTVVQGSVTGLLGANGAGKSTTLNAIAGIIHAQAGRVVFAGCDITNKPAYRIVRQGLAIVPEGRRVVAPLSVRDNLLLSTYARGRKRVAVIERIWELFPRLQERRNQLAGLLSGGEQQMLAMGRALMTAPTMLLLDEPSMGLSPAMVDVVVDAIRTIQTLGITVLLVEQNAAIALPLCDYAYLIHRGGVVASGERDQLEKDPTVIARHLGLDSA